MDFMLILVQTMLYLTIFGYGLSVANILIGISRIKNLKEMNLTEIKGHKLYGRIEILLFYILAGLCIYFAVLPKIFPTLDSGFFSIPTIFWHMFF